MKAYKYHQVRQAVTFLVSIGDLEEQLTWKYQRVTLKKPVAARIICIYIYTRNNIIFIYGLDVQCIQIRYCIFHISDKYKCTQY